MRTTNKINEEKHLLTLLTPITSYWDSTWTVNEKSYKLEYERKYIYKEEYGEVSLNLWDKTNNELLWSYSDSLYCDWQDVVVYSEFKKPIVANIDRDEKFDIVLVYILDCTTDVSPLRRHLIYYNTNSKVEYKLSGWNLDPISPRPVKKENLKYVEPEDDFYTLDQIEGLIENYSVLKTISRKERRHLIDIWLQANEKDIIEAKKRMNQN